MSDAPRLIADQVYSRIGGVDRLADVWLPAGAGPHPVIVFLHGGGWRFGDRRLGPDLSRHFAQAGFAMVSIDYRLSTEVTFPAPVIDTRTAVRWVRAQAAEYGFDPARIGLWGSSAGGHLALMAGLAGPGDYLSAEWAGISSAVQAISAGYPPTDVLRMDDQRDPTIQPGDDPESARLPPARPISDPEALEALFLGAPAPKVPERAAEANPVRLARADAPPVLLMHGTRDAAVPLGQSRLMFDALAAAGAPVTLAEVAGLGHGFLNRTDLDDRGALEMTLRRAGQQTEVAEGRVFAMTLDFFRRNLGESA